MSAQVSKVLLNDILPLRDLYRQEMHCQIVHDSWHERGFTDSYLITIDGRAAGYGSAGGLGNEPKDLVKEFYLLSRHRSLAQHLFREFLTTSGARRIEAQSNDLLLTLMLYDHVETIERDRIVFEEAFTTDHVVPGATFRRIAEADLPQVFGHELEPVGDWGIELEGQIVATGGLTFYYNPPYADLYMEVAAPWRRRGLGSFLVQELKRVCYEMGKIPGARCQHDNTASRATLEKAGLLPCAWILNGQVRN